MSRRVRSFSSAVFVSACVLLATVSSAQRPVQRLGRVPSNSEARVALRGTAGPHTAGAEQTGDLPGTTPLTSLSLILKPSAEQDTALTQLLQDQANPASASYQQWLTPEQFGERFGAADADIQKIENWLQGNGFAVQAVAPSRNRIVFSGSAATAEGAFRTTLRRYHRGDRDFFENSDAVQLPASLASVVSSVTGLSSYRLATPQVRRPTPQYTTSTGTHYIVPDDLRTIYGTNMLIGSGYNGNGIKIGVLGQSAIDTAQLTYFQQKTGQTLNLPTMVLVPNTGTSNKVNGDEAESELDLEYASGNAPGASIQFIYTGCTNTSNCGNNGVFDAILYAVTNNLAPILSLSYGGCEQIDATYAASTLEPMLRQANAQGQTLVVAAGDFGAASCETDATTKVATAGLAVSYPASSPYVTGVGGTQLNSDSGTYWNTGNNSSLGSAIGYVPETSWNDTIAYGSLSASGGGVSQIFSKPTWQVGTGVPADGHRDVPDVAFPASVSVHAYLTCDANGPCTSGNKSFTLSGSTRDGGGVGGTSAAAPSFAGMLAVVEQANGGKALGNINPSLYALAEGPSASSVFHDITTGNNMVSCNAGSLNCTTGMLGYSAGVGYDQVTGLGSIAIPALRTALAAYAASAPRILLSAPSTVTGGIAVTFSVALSGSGATPTGTVTFAVDGNAAGSAQTLTSGTASYTYSGFTSIGTHTVSVTYSGDSTYSTGNASTVVTAVATTPTLTFTANPASPAVNAATTLTATLGSTGSVPSGTVIFTAEDRGTSTALALVNGTATYTFPGFTSVGLHTVTVAYTPATGGAVYNPVTRSMTLVVTSPSQTLSTVPVLTLTPNSLAAGLTFNAVLMAPPASGTTPTGTVAYSIDNAVAATSAPLVNGTATATLTASSVVGTHTVVATYSGDNNFRSATASSTYTVVPPSIGLAVSPTTLSTPYGSTATGTLNITSSNGAAGATTFALSLVSYTGASFQGCYRLSPSTVNLAANGAASTTLTLYTTLSSCTAASRVPLRMANQSATRTSPWWGKARTTVWAALPLPLLLLLLRRRGNGSLLAAAVFACCVAMMGCGSGSSTSTTGGGTTGTGGTTTTPSTTNTGSYVVRVSATTAATTGTLTANTTLTLNVQ